MKTTSNAMGACLVLDRAVHAARAARVLDGAHGRSDARLLGSRSVAPTSWLHQGTRLRARSLAGPAATEPMTPAVTTYVVDAKRVIFPGTHAWSPPV